jgi:hypothetical protein
MYIYTYIYSLIGVDGSAVVSETNINDIRQDIPSLYDNDDSTVKRLETYLERPSFFLEKTLITISITLTDVNDIRQDIPSLYDDDDSTVKRLEA